MKEDYLIIAVDPQSRYAIRFLCLEHGLRESIKLHRIPEALLSTYKRSLLGSVLLGSRADEQDTTLFKFDFSNSPLTINTEVTPRGFFRSAIFPPEKIDEFVSPPEGQLKVTKLSSKKDVYESIIEIANSNLTDSLRSFLNRSNQTDSVLFLSATEDNNTHQSFGLWVEKLPDTKKRDWEVFCKRFENDSLFQDSIAKSSDPDEIIGRIFPEGINILAVTKPRLHCSCSKDRFVDALSSLPEDQLVELFMDGQGVESQCDYCHTVWTVTDEEFKDLLKVSPTKH